jgi:hypothetical protein
VITLGDGNDLVVWSYYPDSDVIADFTLGDDRLDVRKLLVSYGVGYGGGSPLAGGHIACVAGSGGVAVRFDRDGSGATVYGPVNYALVKGTSLTPANLCQPENFIFTEGN